MSKRSRLRPPQKHGQADRIRAQTLDELDDFREYKESLLPKLRHMVETNATPEEILKTVQSMAAAKLGTMIARTDSKQTLAAIIEVLNRTVGKPTEKVESTHKFEKLKDQELDALLESRLKEATDSDGDEKH
jgi:hypothetical protein